ncbi:hypothetical protein SAMN04489729_4843 [Amycolatopsis lurida]|uniref:Uncharacterized protein n=1 Tax=Amycolatopsis lurida NRRL 2430 TaxID=1460371 RepID=A0A2P2FWD2_AMYLU|nr:hypothetical protein [Amycolatopsis lurida]KFU80985.1 hypothetical protein BB31_11420 [Amycolatopsis lurida NRRL 2430]SED61961.1 hypothetical protein SAMN04489729_4843 [Amycolatopsis lurida]
MYNRPLPEPTTVPLHRMLFWLSGFLTAELTAHAVAAHQLGWSAPLLILNCTTVAVVWVAAILTLCTQTVIVALRQDQIDHADQTAGDATDLEIARLERRFRGA